MDPHPTETVLMRSHRMFALIGLAAAAAALAPNRSDPYCSDGLDSRNSFVAVKEDLCCSQTPTSSARRAVASAAVRQLTRSGCTEKPR